MSQKSLFCLFIFGAISLTACKTSRSTIDLNESQNIESKENDIADNYIQTFILKFTKSKNDSTAKVEIANTIKSAGYLKGDGGFHSGNNHAELTVKVFDADDNELFETHIDHPLEKTLEYVDDNGELKKKSVSIEEDYAALRMNFDENAHSIKIYEDHHHHQHLIAKVTLK